jgi:mono/diheme cytochrome c family protein
MNRSAALWLLGVLAAGIALVVLARGWVEDEPRTPVERGRQVYTMVCLACHSPDPRVDGSLGPAIAGASRELLEARVVHGKYPPGYTPKRETQTMVSFPYLAPRIDDLHAYLQDAAREPEAGR